MIFVRLFDVLFGFERAAKIRAQHGHALEEAVDKRDLEYDFSKQFPIERSRENRQESISRISRGESVLSTVIAGLAITISESPTAIPDLRWILFGLTIILVTAVLFRETAIDAFAFTDESPFDSYPGLNTKRSWNGGTLKKSRVTLNMLLIILMRELDERFYQLYLEVIAEYIEKDGISRSYVIREYLPGIVEVVEDWW